MSKERYIFIALEILKQMALGKALTLPNGHIIGMAEDGTIGFVVNEKVSLLSEVTFRELVSICERDNINPIPD